MMQFNDNGDSEGMQKAMEECGFGVMTDSVPGVEDK
jgi:hypothetical protein